MSHRRAIPTTVLASAGILALAACSPATPAGAPPTKPATASSSQGSSPTANASVQSGTQSAASEPGLDTTRPINADNWTSSVSMLPPVRTQNPASHEGFTRVVLEFDGEGSPGIRLAQWSDQAIEQGRGQPIEVDGAAVLELILDGTPMTATSPAGTYPSGAHVRAGALDIVSDGTFEDNTHVVIGAPTERQFQVGFLSNPSRLVVDIRD